MLKSQILLMGLCANFGFYFLFLKTFKTFRSFSPKNLPKEYSIELAGETEFCIFPCSIGKIVELTSLFKFLKNIFLAQFNPLVLTCIFFFKRTKTIKFLIKSKIDADKQCLHAVYFDLI